ncbi:fibronectin type III domain-containing protein [Butyrivibrio sp. AE3006]|uniref:fibronectin type III domain-containing protein n=1 Tax=Butyrivibrio sp. AE3006 TaxID=1280673 RepID=UPI0003F9D17B|nr:fibronectin type III domain-containing protein [Butyrivibrio sp. AE3006]
MKINPIKTLILFTLSTSLFISNVTYSNAQTTSTSLEREEILAFNNTSSDSSVIRWSSYHQSTIDIQDNVHDGNIPVSLLNDPVYCSMNLPSESRSDEMIRAYRDNGLTIGRVPSNASFLLGFGAIEDTTGMELPDKFSVYLGQMKLFAFSKSQNKWITIESQPYPRGIYIYTLPWTTTVATKCERVTNYSNYVRVDLTKEELQGNCLHFWEGKAKVKNDDYLYYAASYDVWVSSNAAGKLTATGGIDTKDSACIQTINQLNTTRGYSCSETCKSVWGNTIPNSEYEKCNSSVLNSLYGNVNYPYTASSDNAWINGASSAEDTSSIEENISYEEIIPKDNSINNEDSESKNEPEVIPTSITKVTSTDDSVTIKWKKQPKQSSGYQIQYSSDKKLKKKVKTVTINNPNKGTKKISKIEQDKNYYVKIRSYYKVGSKIVYSKWSKVKKIRTK